MGFCSKLLVSLGRIMNSVVVVLSLCLFGVAGKIYSNVGWPLLSLTLGDIFCGLVAGITAITSFYTLSRRSKPGFRISQIIGFVNVFMWFSLSTAHYVLRNFKILQASDPEEFQPMLKATVYGCLVACAAQIHVSVVSTILAISSGYVDDQNDDDYDSEYEDLEATSRVSPGVLSGKVSKMV